MNEHANEPQAQASAGQPSVADLQKVLQRYADRTGSVSAASAHRLAQENGWTGRLVEVLELLAESDQRMGYVAGGRHPDEIATWVALWAESPLDIPKIAMVMRSGGWDPDPFVVVDKAGLLEQLLIAADGTTRHVEGELVGAWLSDELAMADDDEIIARAKAVIASDGLGAPVK
jgi:hypothetical protein